MEKFFEFILMAFVALIHIIAIFYTVFTIMALSDDDAEYAGMFGMIAVACLSIVIAYHIVY